MKAASSSLITPGIALRRGGDSDTRDTIAQLARLRAEKGKLLGFNTYAAWKLQDQMAKNGPEAAINFMDALVPAATARAGREAKDIQAVIDAQKGGFQLTPAGLGVLLRSRSARRATT